MDPSLSISGDPHHHHQPPPPPSQFAGFPFATSNPFASSQSHSFFPSSVNPSNASSINHHVFHPPPPPSTASPPPPPHPSFNHPPYSDMICSAIAALNEPDGSSKQAISRYIERVYTGLPMAHGALLTHHLKTLKNSGVLVMVKKSYKFASTPLPASVAVAAAAAAAGFEAPRSDLPSNATGEQYQADPTGVSSSVATSVSTTQKRGRGRPPKPKMDDLLSEPQVQLNGQSQTNWEQNDMSASRPAEEVQPTRRPPGRPKKNGHAALAQASDSAGILKRRGRPPGRRAAGRQRKPKSVAAPATSYAYVANGAKRRGRPKRVDSGVAVATHNVEGGEVAAVLPVKRRGRPPKIGGGISKPMKPKVGVSRTGRPVGRPRKNVQWATGQQDGGYGELKRKFEFLQEKVKEAVNVLKTGVTSENQAVVEAINELEGLTVMDMNEANDMEEEVQTEEVNHEQEEVEAEGQTEAEAMQEALF